MRIDSAHADNRTRAFVLETIAGQTRFPYALCRPEPTRTNRVTSVTIDEDLGAEAIGYRLASGAEGWVHIDQALDYCGDGAYLRDQLLYRLTVAAEASLAESRLSKREIARQIGTSPTQLYRLLDATNYAKSVDSMLVLLRVLGCSVDLTVRRRGQVVPSPPSA